MNLVSSAFMTRPTPLSGNCSDPGRRPPRPPTAQASARGQNLQTTKNRQTNPPLPRILRLIFTFALPFRPQSQETPTRRFRISRRSIFKGRAICVEHALACSFMSFLNPPNYSQSIDATIIPRSRGSESSAGRALSSRKVMTSGLNRMVKI
jgi:hypothetical protein